MTSKSKTQDKLKISEIDENISKLFDIKKRLGKGAYGIVWKALDRRTNETLAVKKIFDAFRDETDAQRTFREICFLQSFRCHPNIITLQNVFKASNNLDIYLVFEYMESDLHNIIKKGTILKDVHKRFVMYQLINAIRYIHSGNVIHRDLKPSNVLIDSKCRCKLADFGLARSVCSRPNRDNCDMGSDPQTMQPLLTDYVATRWYRAPEILVASKRYTKGIDMWSLGCILAEMIKGKPLFQGTSTINQIEKIVCALPDVTEHDVNAVGAGFGSVLLSKQVSTEAKTTLEELLPDASVDALDLVKSLLVLDPLGRLTATQAMGHPYVQRFRHSVVETELCSDVVPPFRDDIRLSVCEYRTKLYEIAHTLEQNKGSDGRCRNLVNGERAASNKQREFKHPEKAERKSLKVRQQTSSNDLNASLTVVNPQRAASRHLEPQQQQQLARHKASEVSFSSSPTKRSSTAISATNSRLVCDLSKKPDRFGVNANTSQSHKNSRSNFLEHSRKYQSPSGKPQNFLPGGSNSNSSSSLMSNSILNCLTPTVQKPINRSPPKHPSPPHDLSTETLKFQRSSSTCHRKHDLVNTPVNGNGNMHGNGNGIHYINPVALAERLQNHQQQQQNRSPPEKKLSRSYSVVEAVLTAEERKCCAERLKAIEEDLEKYKNEIGYFCRPLSHDSSSGHAHNSHPKHSQEPSGDYYRPKKHHQVSKKMSSKSPSRHLTIGVEINNNNNVVPAYRSLPKSIKRERSRTSSDLYSGGGSGDHISYEFYLEQHKDVKCNTKSNTTTTTTVQQLLSHGQRTPTASKHVRSRLLPKVI